MELAVYCDLQLAFVDGQHPLAKAREQLAAAGAADVLRFVRHQGPVNARPCVACGRQSVVSPSIFCRFFVAGDPSR
jgi:hypothetical protein